ncbi:MAG: isoprenylcysteine carboxylmethyltransferase family protein [Chloroflexi bacterium]|nr:isoprenylcysteine carboxylmethyltransferase family protein [Chloroflexota bacterium]
MNELARKSWRGLVGFCLATAALIFAPAWTIAYWEGWLYWVIVAAWLVFITGYFLRKDPELVRRRIEAGPAAETDPRQRLIQSVASIAVLALLLVSSFDHHFGWSTLPWPVAVAGDLAVCAGFAVIFLVFRTNTYTSATVGVESGQQVISDGPYAIVRHPMYSGAVLLFAGTPTALGSWWGLAAAAVLGATLVWRLLEEERVLNGNLPGYAAYRRKVKRHLIPGLW